MTTTVKTFSKLGAISLLGVMATGCVNTAHEERLSQKFLPAYEDILDSVERPIDGAIFSVHASSPLVSDRRARHVGDVLTIQLKESNKASKSNNAKMSKSGEFNVGLPTSIFGDKDSSAKLKSQMFGKDALKSDSGYSFSGTGAAGQSNTIEGEVTVTVVKVFRNGNMAVRGEKRLRLTSGTEYIRISGIVRPEDVTPDNRIDSRRVAQAEISYTGAGGVGDSTQRGWLSKFFGAVNPY